MKFRSFSLVCQLNLDHKRGCVSRGNTDRILNGVRRVFDNLSLNLNEEKVQVGMHVRKVDYTYNSAK